MESSQTSAKLVRRNLKASRRRWGSSVDSKAANLKEITQKLQLSVDADHLVLLDGNWYVTHSGLLAVAHREGCQGINTSAVECFCDPAASRWAFKAVVFRSESCRGFAGYGDADPYNVGLMVRGAEMRMAETRAVNRALRKAYGVGLCSIEELGTTSGPPEPAVQANKPKREPGISSNGNHLRDRLLMLIRHQKLDSALVKAYAADFCGVGQLRDASKEKVEEFIQHLSEYASNDRAGLLCQLNGYARTEGSAA